MPTNQTSEISVVSIALEILLESGWVPSHQREIAQRVRDRIEESRTRASLLDEVGEQETENTQKASVTLQLEGLRECTTKPAISP